MANEKVNRKLNGEGKEEEEEPKIPVFTVLKNGAILKNIFIVNKSPPLLHSKPISTVHRKTYEEILVVGRHPDCNIVLTHPSISRFHLQILSDPFSQKLFLTDLSSVHGTWVSDKKIEPGVRVELSEGDTLRLGGSSRVYSLHWIPMRQAYDFETPFVPFIAHNEYENAEQVLDQSENSLPVENKETESPDSNSVGVESLFSDEILGVIGKMEVPSAPPLPENAVYSIFDPGEEGSENLSKGSGEENEVSSFWAFGMENQRLLHCVTEEVSERENPESSFFTAEEGEACPAVQVSEESEKQSQLGKDYGRTTFLSSPLLTGEILEETKTQLDEKENLTPESKPNLPANLNAESSSGEKEEADHAAQVPEKYQSSLRKDQGQFDILCLCSGPRVMENSTLPTVKVLGEDKDEQVPEQSLTPEPKSSLLISQKFEHFDEKEKEAYAAASVPEKIENQRPSRKDNGQTDISCLFSGPLVMENLSLPIGEVLGEIKDQKVVEESLTLEPKSNLPLNVNFEHSDEKECLLDVSYGELENKSMASEDYDKRDSSISSASLVTESGTSSMSELINNKEGQTPQSLFTAAGQPESELCESPPLRSENKSSTMMGSIWERRGKPASAVKLQTDKSRGKPAEAACDDGIEQEGEIFTPDKENLTPNTLRLKSLKKKGKIEFKHSKSSTSSSLQLTPVTNISQQELIESPGKENQVMKELQEIKLAGNTSGNQARAEKKLTVTKVRTERIPFQSIKSSEGKSLSEDSVPNTATRSSTSFSYTQNKEVTNAGSNKSVGEGKRSWTMVADATTLLDKESRKSLQFLQGLKGTQLIIPRMVIRELDCLKQRGSLFRKKTEAELVLEWIKECMVKTNWWIHVQSSMEDGRLIAPTPPASPQSLFSEKSWGFPSRTTGSLTFSRCGSMMDLVSPSPEDHILDCALLYRRMKRNDGQLVLLSNDVTLKIKAMEEGLLCETAEEFREGLVNPLSERFLWPDSSPCGRTWSYLGNGALREKYNSCGPLKKSSKGEGAKGLKLILHHNAHYGQIR
ncbi:LOW QUALITY PROTEIN: FHA domain-containing protein PS1 [Pyrus x bretschneideri]|uniref:LOW QUALITY PROTEIN: FHA domain-containing protein PS1 n=1 Tax=Pyrus x bretschneideri TaxID=225117 RepID=UPI00202E32E9|nr:LOW QUALITY PROTEIN: FHA domain-containing protein PS1 [Pyrus x bretschneideri]